MWDCFVHCETILLLLLKEGPTRYIKVLGLVINNWQNKTLKILNRLWFLLWKVTLSMLLSLWSESFEPLSSAGMSALNLSKRVIWDAPCKTPAWIPGQWLGARNWNGKGKRAKAQVNKESPKGLAYWQWCLDLRLIPIISSRFLSRNVTVLGRFLCPEKSVRSRYACASANFMFTCSRTVSG